MSQHLQHVLGSGSTASLSLIKKDELTPWSAPACSNKQHSVHVDDNMKLYRFTSAGV